MSAALYFADQARQVEDRLRIEFASMDADGWRDDWMPASHRVQMLRRLCGARYDWLLSAVAVLRSLTVGTW